jgi:pimeloyl-ACP methyl ester carboxylesterase
MHMNHRRAGRGKPLLLVHGLGGHAGSWAPVWAPLAQSRELIAVDLPGFGATPQLTGETSIATLADALTGFLDAQGLRGVDAVGSSMGARLVLELARRGGVLGAVVSLDPGGFWRGWERHAFFASIWASIRAVRLLQPLMPVISQSRIGRSVLLAQFSRRPWALSPGLVLDEMRSYARSPAFDELLYRLAYGEEQQGAAAGSIGAPLVIGWGRNDLVCLPRQARRATTLFPDATLHWFDRCGHFPHWDRPAQTVELILATTAGPLGKAASAPDLPQTMPAPMTPAAAV